MLDFDKKILEDIEKLKGDVEALSRSNQSRVLKFGVLTVDADSGVTVDIPSGGLDWSRYFYFKQSGISVGNLLFRRYTYTGDEISDMAFRSIHSSSGNRNTYITMDIYKADEVTRDVFLQMNSYYQSGVFQSASINFAKEGKPGTMTVKIDDTDGHGYMTLPTRASDPAVVNGGAYYNTTLNVVRFCQGGVWRNFGGWNGGISVTTPFGPGTLILVDGCITNITYP